MRERASTTRSVRLLAASGASSRSVVLLSDGADVGSVAKAEDVVQKLKDEHVRVFAVGLVSKAFDRSTLVQLAAATGGSFTAARSPADTRSTACPCAWSARTRTTSPEG